MTVFYLLLYYIWRDRYHIQGRKNLTLTMPMSSFPWV